MRWNEWNFPQKKWRFFRWANHRTRSNSWPERSREYGWWSQGPEQVTDVLIFIINMFVDVIHVSFSEYIYIYIFLIYICWVIFKNRSMVIHHEKISWKSTGDVFLLTIQAKKRSIFWPNVIWRMWYLGGAACAKPQSGHWPQRGSPLPVSALWNSFVWFRLAPQTDGMAGVDVGDKHRCFNHGGWDDINNFKPRMTSTIINNHQLGQRGLPRSTPRPPVVTFKLSCKTFRSPPRMELECPIGILGIQLVGGAITLWLCQNSYWKSPFSMGKSTINGHFQ